MIQYPQPAAGPTSREGRTFAEFLCRQWTLLCRGMGFSLDDTRRSRDDVIDLLGWWGTLPIDAARTYRSYVAADGFPAELSLSWRHGVREVRILVESLGPDLTPRGAQTAGRSLSRRLAEKTGVDVARYLDIEDLFLTGDPRPSQPTIWHSLAFTPGHPPRYKVYLNPCWHGDGANVIDAAMTRLGLSRAWRPLATRQAELASRGHRIEFFALDLRDSPQARVKVYYRHHDIPYAELDTIAAFAHRHDSARANRAFRRVYPVDAPIRNEPMTCLAFRLGHDRPEEANVYLREPAEHAIRGLLAEHHGVASSLAPTIGAGVPEFLSYRTCDPSQPADVGLYLRFPLFKD